MNLTLWWIKPLAIGLSVLALFGTGYYKGYEHEKDTFEAFKATSEAEAKTQIEHNKIVLQEQAKVTSEIILDRDKSLNELRKYYANKNFVIAPHLNSLRDQSSGRSMLVLPKTSEPVNADTESNRPSTDGTKTEGVTVEDCSEDVLTLLELQHWITKQELLTN